MKYSLAAASLLSLAAAQIPELPSLDCDYQLCILSAFNDLECGLTDNECYCSQFDDIAASVLPCLQTAGCSSSDVNCKPPDDPPLGPESPD